MNWLYINMTQINIHKIQSKKKKMCILISYIYTYIKFINDKLATLGRTLYYFFAIQNLYNTNEF